MQTVESEVELLAIAAGDQCVAYDHRAEAFLLKVVQSVEVAEAFGHLGTLNHQVSAMEPMLAEVVAVGAFGLCNLIFMVRKAQVDAAAV